MPRKYRLTGDEIKKLSGARSHGALFSLLSAPIPGNHPKCAFVVSKKVAARATDRNTIKRRCRSALSKRITQLHAPLALVFHAKRESLHAPFSAVASDIDALLRRLPVGRADARS